MFGELKIFMLVELAVGSSMPSLNQTTEALGLAATSQEILAGFPSHVYAATMPIIFGESTGVERKDRTHETSEKKNKIFQTD